MNIRRLTQEDCNIFRSLRLEALQTAPDAFGSSYENERQLLPTAFANRLNDNIVMGCLIDGELVGMAGLTWTPEREKTRHIGAIWGVYVIESARRKKVAAQLVEAILKDLPSYIEQVRLTVTAHNQAARSLYNTLGFEEYGFEKRALKIASSYYDEYLLVKFIK